MSQHVAFRRQPVPGELALRYATTTLPAPIRGLSLIENWAYVKPGSANVLDNWFPTQKGLRLRGGTERWCSLPAPVEAVRSGFEYISGSIQRMFAATNTRLFDVSFADAPALVTGVGTINNGNFSTAQMATASGDYLLICNDTGQPVRRYDGTTWTYLDLSGAAAWVNSTSYAVGALAKDTTDNSYWRCLVAHTSPGSGTFAAARTANPTYWSSTAADNISWITGPAPAPPAVAAGAGLTYVWKYRNRLFFVQGGTMNAYCLPINAVGGALIYIPLSGAFRRGGSLLFGAVWSADAGDGTDDKCCFFTDQGEVAIFNGTDPTNSLNWSQQGRYDISRPIGGKNGHQQLGGDVLVITVDGVVPLSACLSKDVAQLSLAAVTLPIEPMWMEEFRSKNVFPWPITKWDEGDMLLVGFPGGNEYNTKTVAVSNVHTSAWTRFVGWDALCFMKLRGSLFFGTQDGKILQCDSTGYDDTRFDDVTDKYVGNHYVCTMIGGWEMFQSPPNQVTWFQARANFFSSARQPFIPQLAACIDYQFRVPPPPPAGPDPGLLDVWDQGLWDQALWDQSAAAFVPAVKNTMWVSIGETGFSHAPICQVTVAQQVKPDVELISISATFVRMGVNV